MLDFSKSLKGIMVQRKQQAEREFKEIMNPDVSKRLRLPSFGDPPRQKPKRSEFKSNEDHKAALDQWNYEQTFEAGVYEKALR